MPRRGFIGPQTKAQAKRSARRSKRKSKGNNKRMPKNTRGVNGGWAYGNARARHASSGLARLPAQSQAHLAMCCSALNPFDPRCRGMKWPDGFSGQSVPFQIRGRQTFLLSAATTALGIGISVNGTLPYSILSTASGATTVYTMNSTYTEVATPAFFASTYASGYRIVCWGVRINVTSAVPNTSGTMILTTNNSNVATSATYNQGTMEGLDVTAVPIATGKEYIWVSRPVGSSARTYSQLNTSAGTVVPSWTTLFIDAYGGTSGTYTQLELEYVYNVEMQLVSGAANTTGLAHVAPKDPAPNPRAIATVQQATLSLPHVHEGGTDSFAMVAERAVKAASGWAMEAFGEMAMGML
jgi:hypothetical protein